MFITILSVILILAGLALLAFGPRVGTGQYERRETGETNRYGAAITERVEITASTRPGALIPLLLAAVLLFLGSITTVEAKQVGVVTTFGRPSDQTLSSGFHLKAPWQKVTEIDATIQTDEYHAKSGIDVRLSDGNTATISATIRWSVSDDNANKVYEDFRSDDPTKSLRDAVVSTQFKAAMNAVFAGFDPLTLAGATGDQPDYNALADKVRDVMLAKTNSLVEVDSVTISLVSLDKDSQKKIDNYIGEVSKTRIAEQAQKTAKAQAEANRILSDSISRDPNVLVSKCLDLLADGYNAPAGFTCWPGAGGGVVIPGTR